MREIPYFDLPELSNVYLEESYVLNVDESGDVLRFELDVALSDAHPLWRPPNAGERHCYRRGVLEFSGVRGVTWTRRSFGPLTDKTGEVDYGTIDLLTSYDSGYHIAGEWGDVNVAADHVKLVVY